MKTMKIAKVLALGGAGLVTAWSLAALSATALTMDTAVDQRQYTGDGDWDVGRTKAECAQTGAVAGVSVNPSNGVAHSILCQATPNISRNFDTVDYALGDNRHDTATGDWDPGYTKGECPANYRLLGMSEDPVFGQLSRLQCSATGITHHCHAVVFANGDNRGTTSTGDWAPGFFKGECATNEVVKGVSKTFCGGSPHAILCCQVAFTL